MMSFDQRDHPGEAVSTQRMLAWGGDTRAFEIPGKRQRQRGPLLIQLLPHVPPRGHEDDGLCSIAPGCLEDGIDILARVYGPRGLVGIVLSGNLEADAPEYVSELVVYTTSAQSVPASQARPVFLENRGKAYS